MALPTEQKQVYAPAGSPTVNAYTGFVTNTTRTYAPVGQSYNRTPAGQTPIVNPYTGFTTGFRPLTTSEIRAKAQPVTYYNTKAGLTTVKPPSLTAHPIVPKPLVPPSTGPGAQPGPRPNPNGGGVTTPITGSPLSGTVSSLGGILSQLAADATRFAEPLLLIALLILVYSYLKRHRRKGHSA